MDSKKITILSYLILINLENNFFKIGIIIYNFKAKKKKLVLNKI